MIKKVLIMGLLVSLVGCSSFGGKKIEENDSVTSEFRSEEHTSELQSH